MPGDVASEEAEKYPGMSYLGEGAWGLAYDVKSGQVVKYTTDADEAISAQRIQECQSADGCNWAARVYHIQELKTTGKPSDRAKLFAIVLEKLEHLNKVEYLVINLASSSDAIKLLVADRRRGFSLVMNDIMIRLSGEGLQNITRGEVIGILNRFTDMLQSMATAKAKLHDVKPENIGKRADGNFAMLDMGFLLA
jgi:hypothetical protein